MTTSRPSSSSSVALWQQLAATAQALQAVRTGQSSTSALAPVPAPLRPGVQALLFQVLRNLGRAQALRRALAPRNPAPAVDALLCCALALAWEPQTAPYEIFTLVNQTVEAAKRGPAQRQAAFINACLRRFVRERAARVTATDSDLQARWNHPLWWIEQVQHDYPAQWQAILQANNTPAPMTLRVNRTRCSRAQYLQALQAMHLDATVVGDVDDWGLQLHPPQPVERLPGWREGWVSVQDAAAQYAAPLALQGLEKDLSERSERSERLRVLDACAAPGGKTAHLLEYAYGSTPPLPLSVTALEIDAVRCERIHDTLGRLGLLSHAQVLCADASQPRTWWPQHGGGRLFDAIVLDAPCTASGIVRRHPDIRWLRRPSDVAQLAAIQAQLLQALWPLLRVGGQLVYCTCSIFHAEGRQQIDHFIAHQRDAQSLPAPGHLLPGQAGCVGDNAALNHDHDGFFYALLRKTPT